MRTPEFRMNLRNETPHGDDTSGIVNGAAYSID